MKPSGEHLGIALLCDRQGTVLQVIRDEIGSAEPRPAGAPLWELLHEGSRDKGKRFVRELGERGLAFDWELDLAADRGPRTLHFAGGVTHDEHLLVVASGARSNVATLYAELMQISNEQANQLRLAAQRRGGEGRQTESDHALYQKLTQVNNELATVQRELVRKNAELERLNVQKNHFLSMAAHDLRNPIGVIRSWSSFLLEDGDSLPHDRWVEYLSKIRSSSDFTLRLLDELLDISVIEAGRLQLNRSLANLTALVRDTVGINRIVASEKQIELECDMPGEPVPVDVDSVKVEQVLNNLLSNAVKFSAPGTRVVIAVTREGPLARVAVRDAGPGIPAGERAALFTPFGRTSVSSTRGERSTGLGLAIAKQIVDAHGGRIWCESEVGTGSTFAFEVPLADPSAAPPAATRV